MNDRNEKSDPTKNPQSSSGPSQKGQGGTVRVDRSIPAPPETATPQLPPGEVERIPVSGMRAAIARRMHQSQRETPLFHAEREIRMDSTIDLGVRLRAEGHPISLGHLLLKAAADSVSAVPEVNARFVGDAIEVLRRVHLAIATALPEGLVFPVLHDAPELNLLQIADRSATLRDRADAKTLETEDLTGATITVSNLGRRGVARFTTVVQPPQAASLAFGIIKPRPVVDQNTLGVAQTVHATLSCDHRALDARQAAAYLEELSQRLENPERLLFGIRLAES